MKYLSLIFSLTLCLFIGCKKDKPKPPEDIIDNRPPSEVVESIITELSGVDSISAFTNALKDIPLTKEETSRGLTIFAPLNEGTVNVSSKKPEKVMSVTKVAETNDVSPEPPSLTEESLKDHIIKGIYNEADLTDGLTITSLSGKSLKITKSGDDLYINGVLISTSKITSGTKEAVYVVQKPLSNTTISDPPSTIAGIEITVWDAHKWSPANPNGEVVSEADVVLYRTQEDYTNSLPAYQGKTNVNGKIKFQNLQAGKYYIEVSKDVLSNMFYESAEPQNGKYMGLAAAGIFQSQDDIESSAQQSDAALGALKWIDINSDGTINNNDFTALPYEFADVENETVQISILIGESSSQPSGPTEQQIRDFFETTNTGISQWHKNLVMLDGVLSDDSDAPYQNYQIIDNFGFNATDPLIGNIWQGAYQLISNLNAIIQDAPGVNMENPAILLGQAKALRAYIYLQLVTYFGNVPLQTERVMSADITSASKQQIYTQIEADLSSAIELLPESIPSSEQVYIDRLAAFAIFAKVSLVKGGYNNVEGHVGVIMNSGKYTLAVTNDNAFTTNSPETIWDNSSLMSSVFKTYFYNRQICPYIRYTEIYLIAAEAALESPQGNLSKAIEYLNILREREGLPPLNTVASTADVRAALRETWRTNMRKEGNRFANLVRWGTANEVLGSKGFSNSKNEVLPIPQAFIDQFTNVNSTPGY